MRRLKTYQISCNEVVMRPQLLLLPLFAALALLTSPAQATTVRGMSLEEQVLRADLVALVECTTAGGIVAQYRVVAVYKGDLKPDSQMALRDPPNFWEPQFPIALVGERFIVAAYRGDAPSMMLSTTLGGPVPVWFRQQKADFALPLFQGRSRLPDTPGEITILGEKFANLDAFGARVRTLTAEPAPAQELRLAKAYIRSIGPSTSAPDEGPIWSMAEAATSVDEIIQVFAGATSISRARFIAETLETQHKKPQTPPAPTTQLPPAPIPDLSAETVELYGAALLDPANANFGKALEQLTAKRPDAAANVLMTWKRPNALWNTADTSLVIGSYFGWRCPPEARNTLLPQLTDAQDPHIRVAAAIYWAMDDEPAGTAKLAELMKLPGDPGGWAALALASRGNKQALDRAVELLETPPPYTNMAGVPHRNLQKRVLVLLSNSAAASKLPAPPADTTEEGTYPGTAGWYREHRAALTLHDPWFAEFLKQRVD